MLASSAYSCADAAAALLLPSSGPAAARDAAFASRSASPPDAALACPAPAARPHARYCAWPRPRHGSAQPPLLYKATTPLRVLLLATAYVVSLAKSTMSNPLGNT